MKTINLIELLKRCKKGDKEALGLLYTTYSRRMMRVICHYIPDLDAAQDILHDGFLIIFSRINQLRNAEKLEYWMGTIMKNLALQYLKEQDFIQLLTEEYDTPDIPDFEESITIEEMEIMINRLPVGYQKVFRLAVLENKTHKEIAKLLGISAQTSGSQLFHARNMLREMIVKYKTEKGMAILAIIIIAMIFQHNQNDHKVQTISEPTKLRTEKNKDIENKVEQNEESIRQIALQNSMNTALLSEICVEKADSLNLSTKAENLLAETKTDNGADANTAKHDICSNPNKMESSARAHHSNDLPITKRNNRNFSLSVGGSVIGALNTENAYLKPSDNPIWAGSNDKVIEESEHDLPITFALNISKTLSNDWSIESGLQYTLLRTKRTQTTISDEHSVSVNRQNIKAHYLGVPLKLRFKILSFDKFSLSSGIGGMVEFPLRGKVNERIDDGEMQEHNYALPMQWSVYGGIGIEYHFTPNIGIYAEPSINYYFKSRSSYPTIRQDKPFEFSLPVGLRFTW
ncbi:MULTISPECIES: sigma-70 family RNA polymerase sigma factor [Bacteroidaceae]|jgi:RNA polymerase sigma factor (sigma-70 family)|uniref:RNA polymerase sigma factor, sigma-70 family n=1 Tax=Bacteroides ovatus TaxID=28116 RepID=A0A1G8EM88_BACOV|nr:MULTISPECIES: sigma-70 family RNA polymerase sigma factor [Bacteroidaceae]SDH71016.1 RNA polymerase sigma factor, sigma-70 family [Bacteroides ovatus]